MTDTTSTSAPMKKRSIPAKIGIAFATLAPVAAILTGIMTWANTGFSDPFLNDWLVSFLKAIFVLMPFAMVMMAILGKVIESLLPNTSQLAINILLGLLMSVLMQGLMGVISVGTTFGFADNGFVGYWWNAFITAMPVGLPMAMVMTVVIRPRLMAILKS